MLKRIVRHTFNKLLSPFGATVIRKDEIFPNASKLRIRLFTQLKNLGFKPTHIVDVGSHAAEWSSDAYKIFTDCIYTLIEPQIEMKPYIDEFCSKAKHAQWILAGAGATQGELSFTIAANSDSSSFAFTDAKAKEVGIEKRMLPIVTIDSVCEKNDLPVPEIIKIDAEGLDMEVLKGAKKMIGKTEIFFIEIPMFDLWPNQDFHSIITYMKESGYEPYDFTDMNRRIKDDALTLIEVAFARKNGILRQYHGW